MTPIAASGLRFDHVVIGVHDLEAAMADYTALGFDVHEGGRHENWGTANALVRFGRDYLELLAVEDPDRQVGGVLSDHLSERGEGLLAYALATDDIAAVAHGLRRAGAAVSGPDAMQRKRPDGRTLSWRILVPGGMPWRQTIPLVVQWDADTAQTLAWDPPSEHPNGAVRVAGVRLLTAELDNVAARYRDGLGLQGLPGADEARAVAYDLEGCRVEVLETQQTQAGGPFEVALAVADLAATARYLHERGLAVAEPADRVLLSNEQTHGAQLVLREVPATEVR